MLIYLPTGRRESSNEQTDTPTDIATFWAAFTAKNIVLHNKAWTELLGSAGH